MLQNTDVHIHVHMYICVGTHGPTWTRSLPHDHTHIITRWKYVCDVCTKPITGMLTATGTQVHTYINNYILTNLMNHLHHIFELQLNQLESLARIYTILHLFVIGNNLIDYGC